MCFGPEMLLSLALTGAGQYINSREQSSSLKAQQNAKDAALRTELGRQSKFQEQSGQAFDDTLGKIKASQTEQGMGDLISKRDEALQGAIDSAPTGEYFTNISDSAPEVVKSSIAQKLGEAVAKSKEQAQRLAKLGANQDQVFNNNVAITRGGNDISTVSNFAGNSANINRAEQAADYANAAKNPSGIGDLLGLAGQGLGLYSMTGGTVFPKFEAPPSPDFIGPMPRVKGNTSIFSSGSW